MLREHRIVSCVHWLYKISGRGARKKRNAGTADKGLTKRYFKVQQGVCRWERKLGLQTACLMSKRGQGEVSVPKHIDGARNWDICSYFDREARN
jgi:hypothetical protein